MKKYLLLLSLLSGMLITQWACQTTKNSSVKKMLRFNLEAGRGYDYEMNMDMEQEVLGQPMKMEMAYYYSMDVADGEKGNKQIVTAIDRLRIKMGMAGMNIDVDTDKPASGTNSGSDPFSKINNMLAGVKGRTFTMDVDPEGHVVAVKGMEEMGKAIADSLQLEGEDRLEFEKRFGQQLNEKATREQFERVWLIFPNREVKVGDSWTKTYSIGGQMPGKYVSEYTVKEIEGDMVTLEEETKIEPNGEEGPSVKGKITGTAVVDSRSGLIVNSDQDMKMTVSVNGFEVESKGKTKIKGKSR